MSSIRILIVDDSSFMRTAISSMLRGNEGIEVVGTATNGREGADKARLLKPDLITMDIEMPVMTGLEALKEIMATNPTPVIMISTLTTEGAQATVEALSLGAADFIPKITTSSQQSINLFKQELLGKIRALTSSRALGARFRPASTPPATPSSEQPSSPAADPDRRLTLQERIQRRLNDPAFRPGTSAQRTTRPAAPAQSTQSRVQPAKPRPAPSYFRIVVLGVSTGGPLALQHVLPLLPADLPVPMLIVQHMPAHFTKSLADRLNSLSPAEISEAKNGDILAPGKVYIAPGGQHMTIGRDRRTIHITPEPSTTLHKPSVDVTVDSVVDTFGGNALGIIMTGMGRDGATALKKLHQGGGYILAQDEETSVVYGMPRAVIDEGTADEIHALDDLAGAIATCLGTHTVAPRK